MRLRCLLQAISRRGPSWCRVSSAQRPERDRAQSSPEVRARGSEFDDHLCFRRGFCCEAYFRGPGEVLPSSAEPARAPETRRPHKVRAGSTTSRIPAMSAPAHEFGPAVPHLPEAPDRADILGGKTSRPLNHTPSSRPRRKCRDPKLRKVAHVRPKWRQPSSTEFDRVRPMLGNKSRPILAMRLASLAIFGPRSSNLGRFLQYFGRTWANVDPTLATVGRVWQQIFRRTWATWATSARTCPVQTDPGQCFAELGRTSPELDPRLVEFGWSRAANLVELASTLVRLV